MIIQDKLNNDRIMRQDLSQFCFSENQKSSSLDSCCFRPDQTLREAMEVMTNTAKTPMILVVDDENRLLGVLVDYDIRKALLSGMTMDSTVFEAMNPNPVWLPYTTDTDFLRGVFNKQGRKAIPLLDESGRVIQLALCWDYQLRPETYDNWVVIMAGGFGTRLRPLTHYTPKPMLRIGETPILETILTRFIGAGFNRFMISVHYMADQIKNYFGDGAKWNTEITYLEETTPLGTAGALSLIEIKMDKSIIIINGDLLTKVNLGAMLDFHSEHDNTATMCIREQLVDIPYGVVDFNGTDFKNIVEKPIYKIFVNAGIYVIEPEVLQMIPANKRLDMPDLFKEISVNSNSSVGCFPISEYWLDVGRPMDLSFAKKNNRGFD